jgi:hypothetical protein
MNHLSAVKPVAGKSYMNAGSELQQMGGVQTSTTSNQSKLEEGLKVQGLKFKVPGSIELYNFLATINFKL